jgi:hypothetical protein
MKRSSITSLVNAEPSESSFELDSYSEQQNQTPRCGTCLVTFKGGDTRWSCYGCKNMNCYKCKQFVFRCTNGYILRLCGRCHKKGIRIVESGANNGLLINLTLKLTFSRYRGKTLEELHSGDFREKRFVEKVALQSFKNIEYQSKFTNKGSNFRKQVEIAKYLVNKQGYPREYNLRRHRKQPTKFGVWVE